MAGGPDGGVPNRAKGRSVDASQDANTTVGRRLVGDPPQTLVQRVRAQIVPETDRQGVSHFPESD